jgi:hypothetical protein
MPPGYRSYAFRWFTGYAVSAATPVTPGCPCPDWTVEQTLQDAFISDATLDNAFKADATLDNAFKTEITLDDSFRKDKTLQSIWQRKACD